MATRTTTSCRTAICAFNGTDPYPSLTTTGTANLLASLGSPYYTDPTLLINAQATPDVSSLYFGPSAGNGTVNGQLNFSVNGIRSFVGTLHVQAIVTDGVFSTPPSEGSSWFDVVVTDPWRPHCHS